MWAGCSSSDAVTEESIDQTNEQIDTTNQQQFPSSSEPKQKLLPVPKQKSPSHTATQRFSVQADTVDVLHKKKTGSQSSSISVKAFTPKKFYTVEVGAFRLQSNVNRHRQQLTTRFNLPVRVLFDSSISLTRVCIGTFSTRSFAIEFMKKMQSKYPADYPDCWVSYWTK